MALQNGIKKSNLFSEIPENGLKIGYGRPDDCIDNADVEFRDVFEYSWLLNDMNLRIIREIDNAVLESGLLHDIDRPDCMFGVYDMSSGSKALMLCNMNKKISIWGSLFGNNCNSILLELAETRDITIYLQHFAAFPEDKFKAYSLTDDRMYENYRDFRREARRELPKWIY